MALDRDSYGHRGIFLATYDTQDTNFSNGLLTSYDTWASSSNAEEFNRYIVGLPESSVVLGVTMDTAHANIHLASDALNILGLGDSNTIVWRFIIPLSTFACMKLFLNCIDYFKCFIIKMLLYSFYIHKLKRIFNA